MFRYWVRLNDVEYGHTELALGRKEMMNDIFADAFNI